MIRRVAGATPTAAVLTALLIVVAGGCGSETTHPPLSHPPATTTAASPPDTTSPHATASPLVSGGEASTVEDFYAVPDTSSADDSGPAPDPATAESGRLIIESINVDADLVGVGLLSDGSMETPQYHTNTAGWYTEGPPPGSAGPAVIAAHVDGPNGADVFYDLEDISSGDEIVVTDDGVDHTFVVDRLATADKDELPYDEIWPDTDETLLTLITCDGPYVDGEYEDNLIVYADEA